MVFFLFKSNLFKLLLITFSKKQFRICARVWFLAIMKASYIVWNDKIYFRLKINTNYENQTKSIYINTNYINNKLMSTVINRNENVKRKERKNKMDFPQWKTDVPKQFRVVFHATTHNTIRVSDNFLIRQSHKTCEIAFQWHYVAPNITLRFQNKNAKQIILKQKNQTARQSFQFGEIIVRLHKWNFQQNM